MCMFGLTNEVFPEELKFTNSSVKDQGKHIRNNSVGVDQQTAT